MDDSKTGHEPGPGSKPRLALEKQLKEQEDQVRTLQIELSQRKACPLGHPMQLQDSRPKWKCDLCKRSQSNIPRRLRCARCNFDAYEECRKRCSDASFRMFAGAKCKCSAWLLEGPSGDGWPPSGRQPGG